MAQPGQHTFAVNQNNNNSSSSNKNSNNFAANPNHAQASSSKGTLGSFSLIKALTRSRVSKDAPKGKRRGPKPDTRPPTTRRQELNRQAQRTHRERKELYIKNLEVTMEGLKRELATVTKARDRFAAEVTRLRMVLEQNGIHQLGTDPTLTMSNTGVTSSGSHSSSHIYPANTSDFNPGVALNVHFPTVAGPSSYPNTGPPMNYDQRGIQFVLDLEIPCMEHMQMLCVKAQDTEDMCGHVLMASCPPQNHLIERPDVQYPNQLDPEMDGEDLRTLLSLSSRLPLQGEITPVMAWVVITRHERFLELTLQDFDIITYVLFNRIRCYGFGAVVEEYEVQDAISAVLAGRVAAF